VKATIHGDGHDGDQVKKKKEGKKEARPSSHDALYARSALALSFL
jgi:hypothetical protein